MTYRNDHDAALARVDALQLEVARLERERATKAATSRIQPARSRKRAAVAVAAAAGLGIAGAAFGLALGVASPRHDEAAVTQLDIRVSRAVLDECVTAIHAQPAVTGDRLTPAEVIAVEQTAAPCRGDLPASVDGGLWSPSERTALITWQQTEDQLANSIAMLGVYHRSNPETVDGYASSRQLWLEYERALANRNRAIVAWRSVG